LSEGKLGQLDIAAIFHNILFAYQRIIMDFMGEVSSTVLTARTMSLVERILKGLLLNLQRLKMRMLPLGNLQIY